MKKVLNAIKLAGKGVLAYLKDWKNWLVHGLIGVALLLAAIFVPVAWWIKVIFFLCVIAFNCVRMSLKKKKKQSQQSEACEIEEDNVEDGAIN